MSRRSGISPSPEIELIASPRLHEPLLYSIYVALPDGYQRSLSGLEGCTHVDSCAANRLFNNYLIEIMFLPVIVNLVGILHKF